MQKKIPIAIMKGDTASSEMMDTLLHILQKAAPFLEIHLVTPSNLESIKNTKALLKGPSSQDFSKPLIDIMQLHTHIIPCVSYFPFIETKHPDMDVILAYPTREECDIGYEYQQTPGTVSCQSITSQIGLEKTVRRAFALGELYHRKQITFCAQEASLLLASSFASGIFKKIAEEYPHILNEDTKLYNTTAQFTDQPELFDILILPNFTGKLLTQIGLMMSGAPSITPSLLFGDEYALFQTASNNATLSALLLAAVHMLVYLGEQETASKIHNGWLKTIESGIHAEDLFKEHLSRKKVAIKEFGQEILSNLDQLPQNPITYSPTVIPKPQPLTPIVNTDKKLVGVDVFIFAKGPVSQFFAKISHINIGNLRLKTIFNRGICVWPAKNTTALCTDQWCCRFLIDHGQPTGQKEILQILNAFDHMQIEIIRSECLFYWKGKPGFSN